MFHVKHYFGSDTSKIERYAQILETVGTERGLIGPREVPRIWDRHIMNCVVVVDRIPHNATVADVGSGAGLPGIVWAIARPDLKVTLIEPLLRRATFLEEVITELGLENARVLRSRAEQVTERFDFVTARAVAELGQLAKWTLPLLKPGGVLLALKGQSAAQEIARSQKTIKQLGGNPATISYYGSEPPLTTVVEVALG